MLLGLKKKKVIKCGKITVGVFFLKTKITETAQFTGSFYATHKGLRNPSVKLNEWLSNVLNRIPFVCGVR